MSQIGNILEGIVKERVDVITARNPRYCSCAECVADVTCMTLNRMQPRYVRTNHGALIAKVQMNSGDQQTDVDMLNIIIENCELVRSFPRHDDSNPAQLT